MLERISSLFGSKPPPVPPSPGPQLAMPLFSATDPVAPDAVVAQWAALFPGEPPLGIEGHEGPEAPVQYRVAGGSVMAIHIPIPVPNDEAVSAVKTSWMWQQPDTAVRGHRAHAIVTAFPSNDAIAAAWNVARLSAAMLKAGSGVALYWGSGRQVHAAAVAEHFAQSDKTPPVPLWVGITISGPSQAGPFSAATHGLASLGHLEFEVRKSRRTIGELRTTLLDLAAYVVERGPVLQQGQTFGPSADEKWSIRHEPSKLVPGRGAIVLGMP
jgi:hypothetical protein